jgi:hypothetical protein
MISLYTRVEIPHRKLFGRVIQHHPVPNNGMVYRILIETADGSHVEALYGAASLRIAPRHGGHPGDVVPMPRAATRPHLRLAAVNGVVMA